MAEAPTLSQETHFYEQHKADYLERFPNLFVLIKDDRMLGPFPTAEAAYGEGLRAFGLQPFFVKQVVTEEPVGVVPIMFSAPRHDAGL